MAVLCDVRMHVIVWPLAIGFRMLQAEIGVDAGAYARLLMVHAKDAADNAAQDLAAGTLSAQQILETAFYKTNVQGMLLMQRTRVAFVSAFAAVWTTRESISLTRFIPLTHIQLSAIRSPLLWSMTSAAAAALLCAGSSTACVLVVNGTTLSASNLGDSGFVLVRDGVATFQCPQQQHNFNFPFQLGSADSMSDQPQAAMVSDT